ncbi:hypothetical protein I4U23_010895 [Adineta vaga]|nr:hypothetical protein I4U23_010895 [Adineta vaga]
MNGINVQNQATLSFDMAIGGHISTGVSNSKNDSKHNTFMKEVQSLKITTLGGDPHLMNLSDWSKTVATNPVIIKFVIKDIFNLLNQRFFPNDLLIKNKSSLIEKILDQHLSSSIYCYKNCGDNGTRGTCEPTGYFQFGICKCKPGWTGSDCETIIIEPPKILHGTLCGLDRSFIRVTCNGVRPWKGCPKGWTSHVWKTDLTVCYKNQTEVGTPVYGTLCGLHSSHSAPYNFAHDIACNATRNVQSGTCPLGYHRYGVNRIDRTTLRSLIKANAVCAILDGKEHLSGTLCGLQIQGTINGPSCNGFNPGLSQCPPEYSLQYTAFNDYGYFVCVKK